MSSRWVCALRHQGCLSNRLSASSRPRRFSGGLPVPVEDKPSEIATAPEDGDRSDDRPKSRLSALEPKEDAAVVVIGAGVAGLSAAAHLVRAGFKKVTVLEARGRPGGRLRSSFMADSVIELGAAWDSYEHVETNPVHQAAVLDGFLPNDWGAGPRHVGPFRGEGSAAGSPMRMDATRTLLVDEEGLPIDRAVAHRAYLTARGIEEDLMAYFGAGTRDHGDMAELAGQLVRLSLERTAAADRAATARVLVGLLCARRLRSQRDDRFLLRDHDDADRLTTFFEMPGSGVRVPLGICATLSRHLKALGPTGVRYNSAVQSVRWGCAGTPRAVVTCVDGEQFAATHVIATLPLGVLKAKHRSMFFPSLPCEKVEAIERLGVATINKLYLDYERSFWVWRDARLRLRSAPEKFDASGQNSWIRGITELKEAPGSQHVIQVTVMGDAAAELELYSDAQVTETVTRLLRAETNDPQFPYPVALQRSNWHGDPLSCGAFSVLSGSDGARLARVLAEPVEGVLQFAGEATAPGYHATVRGAALSGIREAERLVHHEDEFAVRGRAVCPA